MYKLIALLVSSLLSVTLANASDLPGYQTAIGLLLELFTG